MVSRILKVMGVSAGVIAVASLVGCAATKLAPGAGSVYVTRAKPAANCKFVGQITGGQGNTFSGAFTTNKNLVQGTMNDMRNQAYNLGGNYVYITSSKAQNVQESNTSFSSNTTSRYKSRRYYRRNVGVYQRGTAGNENTSQSNQFLGEVLSGNVYKCP